VCRGAGTGTTGTNTGLGPTPGASRGSTLTCASTNISDIESPLDSAFSGGGRSFGGRLGPFCCFAASACCTGVGKLGCTDEGDWHADTGEEAITDESELITDEGEGGTTDNSCCTCSTTTCSADCVGEGSGGGSGEESGETRTGSMYVCVCWSCWLFTWSELDSRRSEYETESDHGFSSSLGERLPSWGSAATSSSKELSCKPDTSDCSKCSAFCSGCSSFWASGCESSSDVASCGMKSARGG
jgi:hypothetical protein